MNEAAAQLWAEWAAGRLCLQKCADCGRSQQPPGPVCSWCHSTALTLADIAGTAELVSWSTVHRAPTKAFADQVPYTLALVRVPDGALVEVRVAGDEGAGSWKVGMPVVLALGTVNDRALPTGRVAG
jgi:uncharacterized OB-fold protein